ncbi:hypothetical protein VFPPC_10945 [Pochonia chlamydosporia 170]|uniref:Uncharacterized protein n=1 Tax=Pochonia chlamydosporia 170 TaxID=1380566 RepID=A0A179F0P2_METCM|nr:hypothetical protein VFPPC_10945 [Pochonia chlamydosporia 170]OAQ58719.1 hypothetical protein VFPPC_10945 [Pochonia chlamydosporia 170]
MRLSTALLFGLVALCGAISLLGNTTDGTYVVLIDESGNETHKRISDPLVSIEDAPPVYDSLIEEEELHRRPIVWHIWCGCGFTLDHGHCDAAVADLKSQIGEKTQYWWSAAAWYSIRGSVVAFACARLYPY